MSEPTEFRQRQPKWYRTLMMLGAVVVAVSAVVSAAKTLVLIPEQINQHSKSLERLERVDSETAAELRRQWDLLLEIRGDVKNLNRNNRNVIRSGTPEN